MATVIINLEASVAGMLWTGSLGWLEHPADNREVAGSNPASSTFPAVLKTCLDGKQHEQSTLGIGHGSRVWKQRC